MMISASLTVQAPTLAAYALDFSYLGVYLANLVTGHRMRMADGALASEEHPGGRHLPCLPLLHLFSDMFTPLSTILQFAIQSAVQRKCFHWGRAARGRHGAQVSKVHPVFVPRHDSA